MKTGFFVAVLNLFLCLGLIGHSSAGPIIVGNGSGLSEFNVLVWQRQLNYLMAQCHAQPTCYKAISATDWPLLEEATKWMSQAQFQFEDETTMGTAEFIFERKALRLRLNKNALWVRSSSGEPQGMNLEEVSDFLWEALEPVFLQGTSGLPDFRSEFKKIIHARANEYSISLSDGRRLATVNSGSAEAGFAILGEDEKAEALLFLSLNEHGECQAEDGSVAPSKSMRLENLDFAFFVGRLGAEPGSTTASHVDLVFNGGVVYECVHKSEKWSEKANARLTIRLKQMKSAYDFVPSATRVRFDSIKRL